MRVRAAARAARTYAPAGVFDGRRIPGIPEHQGFASLAYRHPSGVYAEWSMLAVDALPADDANTERSPSSRTSASASGSSSGASRSAPSSG
jgi:hypothetical protein